MISIRQVTHWPKVEYLPVARETGEQSHVESYQILKNLYLIPPC